MTLLIGSMTIAGLTALIAGFLLVQPRLRTATGINRILLLGPVFEATALVIFAAEHFFDARALMPLVPNWLPRPLFWTYFVGTALLAAAVSFLLRRCLRWSAALLALLFLIIVVTIDLPGLGAGLHDRFFWILTLRETCFAAGAMVLAGSAWPRQTPTSTSLVQSGRWMVAAILIFYAIEHFRFPRHVPGVPLEKLTPAWVPAPSALACLVGLVLLLGGAGLFARSTAPFAAAGAGTVLVLLTALFYVPIFVMEIHSALALEGIDYVGDTLLFAGTVLLAGLDPDSPGVQASSAARQAADGFEPPKIEVSGF